VSQLPEPTVPADVYDETYFRTANWGHKEWSQSEGEEISVMYGGILGKAGLAPGEAVVDVGTGRGEMVVAAIEAGAGSAVGIEYSPAAVALAERTLAAHGLDHDERASVVACDARRTPLATASYDLATLVDVVEHLTPDELGATLIEVHRLLRPGGRLLVHTMPNRLIYDVTYRVQRGLRRHRRASWPANPRGDYEKVMHVNEMTARALRRALKAAGFSSIEVSHGLMVHAEFVPDEAARGIYGRLARTSMLRRFGAADLWAQAQRP
jgi:ubiquinone/menaquinone biosynthesis C-methylase UbiE